MNQKPDQLGALSVGSKDRAQNVGQIDPGETKPLAGGEDCRQRERRQETPQQPVSPVHTRTSSAFGSSGRSGKCRGIGASPSNRRDKDSAALISPTWVNACGKLP